jgi:hypothetical protein
MSVRPSVSQSRLLPALCHLALLRSNSARPWRNKSLAQSVYIVVESSTRVLNLGPKGLWNKRKEGKRWEEKMKFRCGLVSDYVRKSNKQGFVWKEPEL